MQCHGLDSYYSWLISNYNTPVCQGDSGSSAMWQGGSVVDRNLDIVVKPKKARMHMS